MLSELGQIHIQTAAGNSIVSLMMQDPSIKRILDIGCWNGLGTTLCCVQGALSRPNYEPITILALETNKTYLHAAIMNWDGRPGKDMIQFVYGRLATTMMSMLQIHAHPSFMKNKSHYDLYYEEDKKVFTDAPLINVYDPVDLVIIDGGEYCGFSDYEEARKLKPKYIFLDDTNTMKTDKVLEHALSNGYTLIFKNAERNGVAILKSST